MITVKNLTKYYGDKLGAEGISFHIGKGEIVGMLGPNGAGKSTILRMLAGYMPPTSGEITIDGKDIVADPSEAGRHIGYLPEIPPLYPEMSVENYLKFLAQIRRVPKTGRANHIAEAMELANVSNVKNRLIKNLSKGYRQRVGIAQAMIGRPEVLIFDEPTVGLDPKQITEVRSLIAHLSQSHTILLSSHILSEIKATCKRVLIIDRGHLKADDSLERLAEGDRLRCSIRLKAPEDAARAALLLVPGVLSAIPAAETEEAGTAQLIIEIDPESDAMERLSISLAEKNIPIFELKKTTRTLEEVFLEVTASQPGAAEDSDKEATA